MPVDFSNPSSAVRMLTVGEQGLSVEFGNSIDERINARVLALARAITQKLPGEVEEIVPSYRSLLVTFNPLQVSRERLQEQIARLLKETAAGPVVEVAGRCFLVPVCYGGELGPDLEFVAQHNGLSTAQVIEIHTSVPYRVYMLGFTPGFPYLGGMSSRIAAPRLPQPRTRIAAGSVGIAGEQTGVYPVESPGGWRLIGRTPVRFFDSGSEHPFLLVAGDFLRFVAIDLEQFQTLAKKVDSGGYVPEIVPLEKGGGR